MKKMSCHHSLWMFFLLPHLLHLLLKHLQYLGLYFLRLGHPHCRLMRRRKISHVLLQFLAPELFFLLLQLLLIHHFAMQGLALLCYRLHLLMQISKWYHLLLPLNRHGFPGSPLILFPAHRHLMTKTR